MSRCCRTSVRIAAGSSTRVRTSGSRASSTTARCRAGSRCASAAACRYLGSSMAIAALGTTSSRSRRTSASRAARFRTTASPRRPPTRCSPHGGCIACVSPARRRVVAVPACCRSSMRRGRCLRSPSGRRSPATTAASAYSSRSSRRLPTPRSSSPSSFPAFTQTHRSRRTGRGYSSTRASPPPIRCATSILRPSSIASIAGSSRSAMTPRTRSPSCASWSGSAAPLSRPAVSTRTS